MSYYKKLLPLLFLFFPFLTVSADSGNQEQILDKTNIILIVVDTLGTKHLGAFDNKLTHTPNIDKLAKSGVLFKRAYSAAPWTKPSLASIFTSMYPSEHGVVSLNTKFKDESNTLAEFFKGEGRKTAGFVSHTLINPKSGYNQGFDQYDIVKFKGNVHDSITSDQVTDLAVNWLHGWQSTKNPPFFLFLHYFDPHFNYQHHQDFDQTSWYKGPLKSGIGFRTLRQKLSGFTQDDVKYLVGLYREEIAYTDFHIGRLLQELEKSGLTKDTLIIFTSDHGEEFMEHGNIGHTSTLFDELVHVPLIFIKNDLFKSKAIETPVSTMDIFPTLASLFSSNNISKNWHGKTLKNLLFNGNSSEAHDIFFEVDFHSQNINAFKVGLSSGPFKLIYDKPSKKYSFFNRDSDPSELKDLIGTNIDTEALLRIKLDGFISKYQKPADPNKPSEDEIQRTPEELEQLKSLGYL